MLTGVCKLTTVVSCLSWGAEYCLVKPLDGFEELTDVGERTWFRIHHWREAAAYTARERAAARNLGADLPS